MSFSTKIEQYAGSITSLDVTNALKQAVDHTLGVIKSRNPGLLSLFVREHSVSSSLAAGYSMTANNVFDVQKVKRGTYICQPIAAENEKDVQDAKSIYYAQSYSPVYLIDFKGDIKIFPDTSASNTGSIFAVYNSDDKVINDVNETILEDTSPAVDAFPGLWKQYVILHAAEILLTEVLSDFRARLSTDVMDALDKAQRLIDAGSSVTGDGTITSVQAWLEDEDEEMVASTLGVASTELSRASAIMNEMNADYGWVTQQIPIIKSMKQEFLANQGMGGVSDSPKEGQI